MPHPDEQAVAGPTLAEIGPRERLDAYCPACRHRSRLDVAALRGRYGALSFDRLGAMLTCSACGARRGRVVRSWDLGPA